MLEAFPWIFGFVTVVGGAAVFFWWRRQYGVRSITQDQPENPAKSVPSNPTTPGTIAPEPAAPDPYRRKS